MMRALYVQKEMPECPLYNPLRGGLGGRCSVLAAMSHMKQMCRLERSFYSPVVLMLAVNPEVSTSKSCPLQCRDVTLPIPSFAISSRVCFFVAYTIVM